MAWKVSQKDGKYRIWSTISDAWVTDWIDRIGVIEFYHDSALFDFKKKVIEQYLKFPHFWGNMDGTLIHDQKVLSAYLEWTYELAHKTDGEEYLAFIDETYDKIMKEIESNEQSSRTL